MSASVMIVCVAVFVGVCAGPFVLLLFLEAAARRLARARRSPQEAPAADVAPAAPVDGPRPPLAPEVTRTAPVIDLAEHRNRRRPTGAAPGPDGPLGRITKDASQGSPMWVGEQAFSAGVTAGAKHLRAATDSAIRGEWVIARADLCLAIVSLVRALGTMPTETNRAPKG